MTANQRIEMFESLVKRLEQVLESETLAVRRMRLQGLSELQREKSALVEAFERELRAFRNQPELLSGMDPDKRSSFDALVRGLQRCIRANVEALLAGRGVIEAVVRKLAESAALASPRGLAPGAVAPLALDRSL